MFGYFLDPAKRLRKRFERAVKRLTRLHQQAHRIVDHSIREPILKRHERQAILVERLADRIEELPLIRAKSFNWLREDIDKHLTTLEAEIERFRDEARPLEFHAPSPDKFPPPPLPLSKTVSAKPNPPLSSPTLPHPRKGATAARTEPARTNPTNLVGQAPEGPGPKQRQRRTPDSALTLSPDPAALLKSGSNFGSPPSSATIRTLQERESGMRDQLDQLARDIFQLQAHKPDQFSVFDWSELTQKARTRLQQARVQLGTCSRWILAGKMVVTSRDDWRDDFQKLETEIRDLQNQVQRLRNPNAVRDLLNAKKPPQEPGPKPGFNPVSLSHRSGPRRRTTPVGLPTKSHPGQ